MAGETVLEALVNLPKLLAGCTKPSRAAKAGLSFHAQPGAVSPTGPALTRHFYERVDVRSAKRCGSPAQREKICPIFLVLNVFVRGLSKLAEGLVSFKIRTLGNQTMRKI